MTFACKNHDFDTDTCNKLKGDCIQGRPGCVLEGKFKLTQATMDKLKVLEKENEEKMAKSTTIKGKAPTNAQPYDIE